MWNWECSMSFKTRLKEVLFQLCNSLYEHHNWIIYFYSEYNKPMFPNLFVLYELVSCYECVYEYVNIRKWVCISKYSKAKVSIMCWIVRESMATKVGRLIASCRFNLKLADCKCISLNILNSFWLYAQGLGPLLLWSPYPGFLAS